MISASRAITALVALVAMLGLPTVALASGAHDRKASAKHSTVAGRKVVKKKHAVKRHAPVRKTSSAATKTSTAAVAPVASSPAVSSTTSVAATVASAPAVSSASTTASNLVAGVAIPSIASATSTPGSSPAAFNRDTFDYSSDLSDSQEAARYQVLVMQSTDAAEVAKLHAANPNLKILMYSESLFSGPGDPQGWSTCSEYPSDDASWFLTDQNGHDIDEDGRYMMNVGNADYQKACVAHAIALAKQDGFDGIMFDNVDAYWQFDVPSGTSVSAYPTTAGWQAAEQSFLNYAGPAVRAAGLLATANIGGADSALWQAWNTPLDGAAEQGFTDDGFGLESGSDWSTVVANDAWSEAHGKYAIMNSENETEAGNAYGLASMMLVDNGYSSYSCSNSGATVASNTSDEHWYPEYTDAEQLGAPVGSDYELADGVYVRQFQNGLVLVNPTGNSVSTFSLGGTYEGATTPSTTAVSLAPTSGLILVRTA